MPVLSFDRGKRLLEVAVSCAAIPLFSTVTAPAQEPPPLQQQLNDLKQEYETTTQAFQLRIAALEQQLASQKQAEQQNQKTVVSKADLAAEQAAKAILGGNPNEEGAKFQGDITSEPTYDTAASTATYGPHENTLVTSGSDPSSNSRPYARISSGLIQLPSGRFSMHPRIVASKSPSIRISNRPCRTRARNVPGT